MQLLGIPCENASSNQSRVGFGKLPGRKGPCAPRALKSADTGTGRSVRLSALPLMHV